MIYMVWVGVLSFFGGDRDRNPFLIGFIADCLSDKILMFGAELLIFRSLHHDL